MPPTRRSQGRSWGLLLILMVSQLARAQSSRPGWGSTPYHDSSGSGVTFRVWAPDATSIYVPGQFNSWSTSTTPLGQEYSNGIGTGVWSADVSTATNGQQYKYYLNYSGGSVWKHDPRSRWVTLAGSDSGANDIIYDPTNFNWHTDHPVAPALNDLFIYELHIGTFYTNGAPSKFLAATNRLDYLKNLGVNAVELLPVAEFGNSGNSWGYDPAQLFAVDNTQYGGPDGLKSFVQACHARGLAVLLDVVHNHYGPELLDMWNFDGYTGPGPIGGGIYFYQSNTNLEITPYGYTRPNFNSLQVSNFVQDNFTEWLSEYHVDGFRWDTPGLMMNADNYGYIPAAGDLITTINAMIHNSYSGKISIAEDVYGAFGFDSAWDTTYPYVVTPVLTNTIDADRDLTVISNALQYNVRYGGPAGSGRVVFLESHDVVGDLNGGVRLATAIDPITPASYRARKLSTLGAAVSITAPGIPMIFQGQEMLENQPFDSGLAVDWSKTNTYSRVVQFYHDLIQSRRDLKGYTPGLEGDQFAMLAEDDLNKLIAFSRWKSSATNQAVVVIANFSGIARTNYSLNFPFGGTWYTHLNSDATNYSVDYQNIGSTVVTANGNSAGGQFTIGPYSVLLLSPTPDMPPQLQPGYATNQVVITWPSVYSEWVLLTATNLTTNASWSAVPASTWSTNGSTVSALVHPASGLSFYRLQKP